MTTSNKFKELEQNEFYMTECFDHVYKMYQLTSISDFQEAVNYRMRKYNEISPMNVPADKAFLNIREFTEFAINDFFPNAQVNKENTNLMIINVIYIELFGTQIAITQFLNDFSKKYEI